MNAIRKRENARFNKTRTSWHDLVWKGARYYRSPQSCIGSAPSRGLFRRFVRVHVYNRFFWKFRPRRAILHTHQERFSIRIKRKTNPTKIIPMTRTRRSPAALTRTRRSPAARTKEVQRVERQIYWVMEKLPWPRWTARTKAIKRIKRRSYQDRNNFKISRK